MLAFLLASSVAMADDASLEIVEASASAHRTLCHRDAAWHCFTPEDGQVLLDVTALLSVGWTETVKSYKTKGEVAVLINGVEHDPVASGAGGLIFDLESGTLYRPWGWKDGPKPKALEWVFVVPQDTKKVRLTVTHAFIDIDVPEISADPPDPRRVASFEVRYSKWHGATHQNQTMLDGVKLIDSIDLGCEVLEVGLSARALEGVERQFSRDERVTFETKFFGLRAEGVGYARPLEERWDKAMPVSDVKHDVDEGKQVDVPLLFCLGDRLSEAELLFRGEPIATLALDEGTASAPPVDEEELGWVDTIKGWLGM